MNQATRRGAPVSGRMLALTVFTCGGSIMVIEMAASRLIAPYYGTSLPVWTALIGTLLIFLSLGYFFGGRLADRRPFAGPLYSLIGVAGISTMVLPYLAHWLLGFSLSAININDGGYSVAGIVIPLLATITLLALPITALGCVSPYAVRLAAETLEGVGTTTGRLYAISNIGSILGTFIPVFVLIPLFGTRNTFLIAGGILLLLASLGLGRYRWLAGWLLVLPALVLPTTVKPVSGLVEASESLYHYIEVTTYNSCKKVGGQGVKLRLNEGHSMHSSYCPGHLWLNRYWDWFSMAPYISGKADSVDSLLIVGLAAGTIAQQYKSLYPNIRVDGVEIDGDILKVARKHFELDSFVARENQYVMDGRTFLYRTDRRYDVIVVDAFRQPYIPFHLTTVEFFELLKSRLTDEGVMVMNVNKIRPGVNRLSSMILATLKKVFPHQMTWSSDTFNDLLVGSLVPADPKATMARMEHAPQEAIRKLASAMKRKAVKKKYKDLVGFNRVALGNDPLTDDRAPVELAWDGMMLGMAQVTDE